MSKIFEKSCGNTFLLKFNENVIIMVTNDEQRDLFQNFI